jgi:hypothetical protein
MTLTDVCVSRGDAKGPVRTNANRGALWGQRLRHKPDRKGALCAYLPAVASCELTVLNVVLSCEPREITTAMIATEMPAAIRPYSMAVAPDSSMTNRSISLAMGQVLVLSVQHCACRPFAKLRSLASASYRRFTATDLVGSRGGG